MKEELMGRMQPQGTDETEHEYQDRFRVVRREIIQFFFSAPSGETLDDLRACFLAGQGSSAEAVRVWMCDVVAAMANDASVAAIVKRHGGSPTNQDAIQALFDYRLNTIMDLAMHHLAPSADGSCRDPMDLRPCLVTLAQVYKVDRKIEKSQKKLAKRDADLAAKAAIEAPVAGEAPSGEEALAAAKPEAAAPPAPDDKAADLEAAAPEALNKTFVPHPLNKSYFGFRARCA